MADSLNLKVPMAKTITDMPIGTGLLAFRDLPDTLFNYISGNKALDFGCGTGRSSRFLHNLGFDVTGVDNSADMIKKATANSPEIKFIHLVKDLTEIADLEKYDLILLSFVLMEINSLGEMRELFNSFKSYLKDDSKIVVITSSSYFYNGDWLSINTNYSANKNAKSGDVVKVYLTDYDLEISDYYWTESDCETIFNESGFEVLSKNKPLGRIEDNREWKEEGKQAPFVVYVLKLCDP